MMKMRHMAPLLTLEMMLMPCTVILPSRLMSILCWQVVHTLLSNMEHEGQLPRRLVAALQSMFTTAAGSRQAMSKDANNSS